jgi:transketolase
MSDRVPDIRRITEKARDMRRHIVRMTHASKTAHVASALSCADILATLYFGVMHVDPARPHMPERDRFILSKGHACLALYAALAEKGYFPKERLLSFNRFGCELGGHPDMRSIPGVEVSSGSLGHGLSLGLGMAIAARYDRRQSRVFVLLGDGECEEGSVWEAVMAAPHFKADNLIVIIDNNGLQILDSVENTLSTLQPLAEKFRAFGWETVETDGHDIQGLANLLSSVPCAAGKPTCVVARTIKGRGISFMEGRLEWHYRGLTDAELRQALGEIQDSIDA